jgi:hypothetical protein
VRAAAVVVQVPLVAMGTAPLALAVTVVRASPFSAPPTQAVAVVAVRPTLVKAAQAVVVLLEPVLATALLGRMALAVAVVLLAVAGTPHKWPLAAMVVTGP